MTLDAALAIVAHEVPADVPFSVTVSSWRIVGERGPVVCWEIYLAGGTGASRRFIGATFEAALRKLRAARARAA